MKKRMKPSGSLQRALKPTQTAAFAAPMSTAPSTSQPYPASTRGLSQPERVSTRG
jgi:hypothetical protein